MKTYMSWYIGVSYLETIQEWPIENQNRIDLKHVDQLGLVIWLTAKVQRSTQTAYEPGWGPQ